MPEDEAWSLFKELRWGPMDEQCCPQCASIRTHYFIRTRRQWQCRDCMHRFSVTSGTVFASHKLPFTTILGAVCLFVQAVKGMSACQLSRNLDVQYRTAFVLFHKIRDSLLQSREVGPLENEVEMDGGYVHTYVRPENRLEDRVDRRLTANQNQNKRAVLVMRERGEPGEGATKTVVNVIREEHQREVVALTRRHVQEGATVFADEHPAYAALADRHPVRQVNHRRNYRDDNGNNQNQAESYFSRMRRLLIGQIHKNSPKFLINYANEIAWREDNRRESSLDQFRQVVIRCLWSPPSRDWAKYWQGNRAHGDGLALIA